MSDPIQIVSPRHNSKAVIGKPYTVTYEQQVQGPPILQGAACTQFSGVSTGPWTTSRPPGAGGIVECAPAPWSAQAQEGELLGVVSQDAAWIRVGVWSDQGLVGQPVLASDPIFRGAVNLGTGPAPDPHGTR